MDTINFEGALRDLAGLRPVFHSEADFQHALAWHLHARHPDAEVRLERPCDGALGRIYLDIWLQGSGEVLGVELKYKTRFLKAVFSGEPFELRNQSAQDIARYDALADLMRLEGLLEAEQVQRGVLVFLTNDPGYWNDSGRRGRVDEEFRLHEGRQLTGTLSWAAHASPGTKRDREAALVLRGRYTMHWRHYSNAEATEFRYVLVEARVQGRHLTKRVPPTRVGSLNFVPVSL